jgi:hypothetical protein
MASHVRKKLAGVLGVLTQHSYHRDIPYGQVGILLTFLGDLPLLASGSASLSIGFCPMSASVSLQAMTICYC